MMTLRNVICPGCGACCDDIQIDFIGKMNEKEKGNEDSHGLIIKNACKMGHAKFLQATCEQRIRVPLIKDRRDRGKFRDASWEEALEKAGRILAIAKRPLIYLGSDISCEAMQVGLLLGEYLGGVVDSSTSVRNGPTVMGVQEAGQVGATAGQSKIRSDLAVYWGTNPLESMPRHMSRYAVYPRGYWTRRGRTDRTIITVDPRRSITAEMSDFHVHLNAGTNYELLSALLTLLHGKSPHPSVEKVTGISIDQMDEILEIMKGCNCGVIYLGSGIASSNGKHLNVELALHLAAELNEFTKFVIGPLSSNCNTGGFNQTASALYGFPFGLDFSRGYPRYNPGEYTTVNLLQERDIDAALLVSSNLDAHLPATCAEYLAKVPTVCIDVIPGPMTQFAEVVLPGVIDAIECEGTLHRFDGVCIYSKSIMDSPFSFAASNEHILNQLFDVLLNLGVVSGQKQYQYNYRALPNC
ncbi:MAG: formylmethanofuran dehydrogenase subunit B [Methanothrix sp.]